MAPPLSPLGRLRQRKGRTSYRKIIITQLDDLKMPPTAQVTVPATTANIGPGFDCLGAALTLYNYFSFTPADTLSITITGKEADRLSTGPDNLVYKSYEAFYNHLQKPAPPVHIAIDLHVPLSRGLGSSSTAIVGGLVGANLLAGSPLNQEQLATLATHLEGHPDNVVPALMGGCQLAIHKADTPLTICSIPWHESIVPIVAIPDFELDQNLYSLDIPRIHQNWFRSIFLLDVRVVWRSPIHLNSTCQCIVFYYGRMNPLPGEYF